MSPNVFDGLAFVSAKDLDKTSRSTLRDQRTETCCRENQQVKKSAGVFHSGENPLDLLKLQLVGGFSLELPQVRAHFMSGLAEKV